MCTYLLYVPYVFSSPSFVLFPLSGLSVLVSNQLSIDLWVYFCAASFILVVCTSILMFVSRCLDYSRFVVSFEIGNSDSSKLVFFFKILWLFWVL